MNVNLELGSMRLGRVDEVWDWDESKLTSGCVVVLLCCSCCCCPDSDGHCLCSVWYYRLGALGWRFRFSSYDHRVYCYHRFSRHVVVSRKILGVSLHDLIWLFGILMCVVISYERRRRGVAGVVDVWLFRALLVALHRSCRCRLLV